MVVALKVCNRGWERGFQLENSMFIPLDWIWHAVLPVFMWLNLVSRVGQGRKGQYGNGKRRSNRWQPWAPADVGVQSTDLQQNGRLVFARSCRYKGVGWGDMGKPKNCRERGLSRKMWLVMASRWRWQNWQRITCSNERPVGWKARTSWMCLYGGGGSESDSKAAETGDRWAFHPRRKWGGGNGNCFCWSTYKRL